MDGTRQSPEIGEPTLERAVQPLISGLIALPLIHHFLKI